MIAVAAIAAAAPAQGQGYNPFEIGASGGIGFPTGDLSDIAGTGYNIAVHAGYKPQYMPIGIRAEAAWNSFSLESANGNVDIPAFTGNLTFGLPLGTSFSPYIIGGAGLYRPNLDVGGATSDTENDFGWNIGGGIKIPLSSSFDTFIEARYNSVSTNGATLSFVPLTFGITF
jgi:opacity protein-like surface antigen